MYRINVAAVVTRYVAAQRYSGIAVVAEYCPKL